MNRAEFFKHVRSKLGPLKQTQVDGFDSVLDALEDLPLSWQAYALATTWHETARTMLPVKEGLNVSDNWRKKNLRYYPWYGRGYVQLTWAANYERADREGAKAGLFERDALNKDLDLAMRPDVAAFILVQGMLGGWFSGKSFASYLPLKGVAKKEQYIQARRIINILDKADLVEDYAQVFEKGLRNAGVVE